MLVEILSQCEDAGQVSATRQASHVNQQIPVSYLLAFPDAHIMWERRNVPAHKKRKATDKLLVGKAEYEAIKDPTPESSLLERRRR